MNVGFKLHNYRTKDQKLSNSRSDSIPRLSKVGTCEICLRKHVTFSFIYVGFNITIVRQRIKKKFQIIENRILTRDLKRRSIRDIFLCIINVGF